MRQWHRCRQLARTIFRRNAVERELDEELRDWVDTLAARHRALGLSAEDARRAALVQIGGIESLKEEVRAMRNGSQLDSLLRDVQYAWRGIRRSPVVSLVIIATLALGIGANTAIFSIVNAILIAPLPFRDSSRLVFVWSDMSSSGYPRAPLSGPELRDLRDGATRFSGFGAIWANTAALDDDAAEPEQLRIGFVTHDFFTVLGADAALGRVFAAEDAQPDAPAAILLTDAVWQRRYGGDPYIVGRRIRVNGRAATIIGVMPRSFRLLMPPDAAVPDDLQAWLPFPPRITDAPRGQKFLRVVGRMKPGVDLNDARAEIDAIGDRISRQYPEYGAAGRRFTTVGLQADGVRTTRGPLLVLFGGVAILLVIACVNVANILLSRASARSAETALRLALGASMSRLVQQYVIEGLILTALGGAAGLLVASVGVRVMLRLAPQSLNRIAPTTFDPAVLAFTAVLAVAWGVLFSLAPLAEARRVSVAVPLQRLGRRAIGGIQRRTRATLVVAQIALGVVLLVSAGLLVRTFTHMLRVEPGFETAGSLTFRLALPEARYGSDESFNAFTRVLQEKLSALPGVRGAGVISHIPYDTIPNWGGPYRTEAAVEHSVAPFADYRAVSPGLMEAMNIRLVEGRFFVETDDENSQLVVIVDDQLARRAWPGASPVGRKLAVDPRSSGRAEAWATVVGVVRHLRHRSLLDDLNDQVFFPHRQIRRNPMAWVVRTDGNAADLSSAVRRTVAALDPRLPIYDVQVLEEYVSAAAAERRFTMTLAATFAVVALVLACVGVYGVIAYSVTRRRTEFGVRVALGAQRHQIVRLAMREGTRVTALGLVIGMGTAAAVAPLLERQLFGVAARDPLSFVAGATVLGAAALLASWLPARRAPANPIEALRAD